MGEIKSIIRDIEECLDFADKVKFEVRDADVKKSDITSIKDHFVGKDYNVELTADIIHAGVSVNKYQFLIEKRK